MSLSDTEFSNCHGHVCCKQRVGYLALGKQMVMKNVIHDVCLNQNQDALVLRQLSLLKIKHINTYYFNELTLSLSSGDPVCLTER